MCTLRFLLLFAQKLKSINLISPVHPRYRELEKTIGRGVARNLIWVGINVN